jgi:NDP-sugar pyrophosphorylase family protein
MNNKDIDVLILCGGLGKRLRSVVSDRPKPMAEVGNAPFLDLLINYTSSFGFKRFILCIGYKGDFIKDYYSRKSNSFEMLFSEERKLLGTAGAIKNAEKLIQSNPFLVMNGDSFCKIDLNEFFNFHNSKKAILSIALTEIKENIDCGFIILDSSGKIESFIEKGKVEGSSYVNAGIYLFQKEILSLIPQNKSYSLEYDLFPILANGRIYGYITKNELIDIGTPERYEKAKRIFSLGG